MGRQAEAMYRLACERRKKWTKCIGWRQSMGKWRREWGRMERLKWGRIGEKLEVENSWEIFSQHPLLLRPRQKISRQNQKKIFLEKATNGREELGNAHEVRPAVKERITAILISACRSTCYYIIYHWPLKRQSTMVMQRNRLLSHLHSNQLFIIILWLANMAVARWLFFASLDMVFTVQRLIIFAFYLLRISGHMFLCWFCHRPPSDRCHSMEIAFLFARYL